MKKTIGVIGFIACFAVCVSAYCYAPALDKAVKLLLENDYYAAIDECNQLERSLIGSDKAELLYVKGECFSSLGKYEKARDFLKQAINYAEGEISTKIYIAIADTYFMQHGYDKAISIYKQLLDNNTDYEAALLFKLGKAYQRNSKWTKSKYYFNKLAKKYPQSLEMGIVKKSSVGGNFFTIQVGCFSNQGNAEKLRKDLLAKGYSVFVTPFQSNGSKLFRVRVGEYVSLIAAEHKELELKNIEHLPTHIFP